jgi:DNA-binding NarL/FixJ family response regulator
MARTCCLAGIDPTMESTFRAAFKAAGIPARASLARLDVTELGKLAPSLLVCDVDECTVDPLELLRQIRFVLPESMIAVYTGDVDRSWGLACHLAGANCLLSKESDEPSLTMGLRGALESGCYTDPRFAA